MCRLAEGIGLAVEVSDSSENCQLEVVEIDRVVVRVGMFHYLVDGRDHHIYVRTAISFALQARHLGLSSRRVD